MKTQLNLKVVCGELRRHLTIAQIAAIADITERRMHQALIIKAPGTAAAMRIASCRALRIWRLGIGECPC